MSRNASKRARLRAGESSADEATLPVADSKLDGLFMLRVLDARVEAAGFAPLLDDKDRRILDSAMAIGRIACTALAVELEAHRSTVWRRVQRLFKAAPELHQRGTVLLGESASPPLHTAEGMGRFWMMAKTYAWGGVGPRPRGALDLDAYNRAAKVYDAAFEARRLLHPPIYTVRRKGAKLHITGPGPLPPGLLEAVRSGQAEYTPPGPPCCRCCSRVLRPRTTGRLAKYCDERCRSRFRRRPR